MFFKNAEMDANAMCIAKGIDTEQVVGAADQLFQTVDTMALLY